MNSLFDPKTFDPSRIPDSAWEFDRHSSDGTGAVYIHWVDRENGLYVEKKVNLIEKDLVDLNKEQYDESLTKRFGEGKSVARIPMNVFYKEIAPYQKVGDRDHLKWWLNHEKNKPYRNFRGKI